MGLWRIGHSIYGEEETWIPERTKFDWPKEAETPPCDICVGKLQRRRFKFAGRDGQDHTGYRYSLTHYGKIHDRQVVERRGGDRRKSA